MDDHFFKIPYLQKDIFTYIGNKRKLLPLIYKAIVQTGLVVKQATFIDLFCGSGVVSRMAKQMGFSKIIANDWEPYAYIFQQLYLKEDEVSIKTLFKKEGGLQPIIDRLNDLTRANQEPYIARYYAPQQKDEFDLKTERLFYTPENAARIDYIRETIETLYPGTHLTPENHRKKNILISLLLYKASIHTNTSGVFKAYYKDFGGYGKHALSRILSPIVLEYPVLSRAYGGEVMITKEDALQFFTVESSFDENQTLVYIDPPYNAHQYGSNYHLLNTITLWDKPDLQHTYYADGSLKYKAGIRPDWHKTKSLFCSQLEAKESFSTLIQSVRARFILVSYSVDGILSVEDMLDILSAKGKVDVVLNPYQTYKGGKKSTHRKIHNLELVFTICTSQKTTERQKQTVYRNIMLGKNILALQGLYNPDKLHKWFVASTITPNHWMWRKDPHVILKCSMHGFFQELEGYQQLSSKKCDMLFRHIQWSLCQNRLEELDLIQQKIIQREFSSPKEELTLIREFLKYLKYLAYPKHRDLFSSYWNFIMQQIQGINHHMRSKLEEKAQALKHILNQRVY